ncbi:MAG: substrate-binding domain-containing protein [Kiritimatiellae bacterium]|nr:substrate-binding domain-containing protein [Kiritimatiellia bacterium]
MIRVDSNSGKNVLVIVDEIGHIAQCKIRGVSAYARRAGWHLSFGDGRHSGDRPDFAKWIGLWQPDGLIVDAEYLGDVLSLDPLIRPPAVFGDVVTETPLPDGCARVVSDAADIAAAAARELLRTGHPNFAFVPVIGDKHWSRRRSAAFAAEIKALGRKVCEYRPSPDAVADAVRFREGIASFLLALPKPCGVFAANDATASLVSSACAECGLSIPYDVALVGVDNHAEYCESGLPPITSISLDFERCGIVTAELLAAMMEARGKRKLSRNAALGGAAALRPQSGHLNAVCGDGGPAAVATYGVDRVVRRASTAVLRVRDGRVSRALEWIRLNATRGIDVADVVAEMGCSRSLADLRFRQAAGHTILDEIHSRRLDAAMSLLRQGDIPIDEIPERCGYVRGPYLGMLFKRTTGRTMRQWRADWLRENQLFD